MYAEYKLYTTTIYRPDTTTRQKKTLIISKKKTNKNHQGLGD